MKPVIFALVAVTASVVVGVTAGCSGTTSSRIPTGADLKGTWNQTGTGFEQGAQANWDNQKVVITEAAGQGFTGFKEYVKPGQPPKKEALNGVVGVDGDILITDEDGIFRGRLVDGKIQGQYAEAGADSTAFNVELNKQ